ncbi:SDR family NAD(P)-dependent oxidoreductase [Paenibacillus sp. D2_2]|uniref:SDR family NAD(P)-dependent oxidoreductase n=1 Tax=Paenibacillus sp. D2_2 TaxID=3073092 RepID=UPI0028153C18|nr:SDR family NAD(P)-dependent oxidoreductase [Paenibacillus sp. D2_2]WMT42202.1 SDR family NAD(P)-dependent oxidoreductase [Paenibacillus sp. D2_2]
MMFTALVTGADRGVGFEMVRGLLHEGYRVIAGRYNKQEKSLSELGTAYGERLILVDLDVGSDESVKAAVRTVKEQGCETVDLLINNAAILGDIQSGVGDELDFADMLQVYNVNALGAQRMTNALHEMIVNSVHKLIVNISSEAGSIEQCSRDRWFAYGMSKAAQNMQSKQVFNSMKSDGVRMLVVHPGWVQTYMRGALDAEAALTPAESANGILRLIRERFTDPTVVVAEQRLDFVDVDGNSWPW